MTGTGILFLVMAALLAAIGLADQRKLYWKLLAWRFRDPEAHEPTGARAALGRFGAFAAAAILLFQGCSTLDLADETSWDKGEFRDALDRAAVALEGQPQVDPDPDSYATEIDQALRNAADGEGPSFRTTAQSVGEGGAYEVTASGESFVFCVRLSLAASDEPGSMVPGADGKVIVMPRYDLTVTVDEGSC